jgi:hypothetical protein
VPAAKHVNATGAELSNHTNGSQVSAVAKPVPGTPRDNADVATAPTVDNDAFMKQIAAVWKDDRLSLYATKWPVPTTLALRAIDRATLHIEMQISADKIARDQAATAQAAQASAVEGDAHPAELPTTNGEGTPEVGGQQQQPVQPIVLPAVGEKMKQLLYYV